MTKIPLVPLKSQIDRIQSAYAGAARRIVDILAALDPQTFTSADYGAALRKAQEVIVVLNDQVRSWAPVAMREAYKESAGVAQTRLELIGAKLNKRYNPARHDRKIDALTRFVLRDFYKANLTMERTVKRFLGVMLRTASRVNRAQVQEFNYEEAMRWITRFLKRVWPDDPDEASQARGSISRQIRDYLLSKLEGEDFIRINGHRYNVRDYAELVARTRMREAQTEAVKEMMRQFDNDLVEIPPHDSPCAEICAPYQGKVYSISGTHPKYPLLPDGGPPWHPNCLLPGARVISPGGVVSGHRAFYRGQAIELSFSEGARLSVTVNHMFLTPLGFAPAYLLRKGDDVFYCPGFEGIIAPGPDGDKRPPLIEDVIRALAEASGMATTRVPVTPEYLHGDGRFCDGQIDIIRTDGLLLDDRQTGPAEPGGKDSFDPRGVALSDLFPDGPLSQVLYRAAHAADSIMGGRRTPSPVFLARPGGGDSMGLANASDRDAANDEPTVNRRRPDPETLADILLQGSGLIQATKVIDVRVFEFSGHVYDLQSVTSLYLGNGILSSNCEDVMNPTSENALRWRAA